MNLGKPYSNGLKQFEKIPDSELLCYMATPLDFIPDRNAEENAKGKVGESCSQRKENDSQLTLLVRVAAFLSWQ